MNITKIAYVLTGDRDKIVKFSTENEKGAFSSGIATGEKRNTYSLVCAYKGAKGWDGLRSAFNRAGIAWTITKLDGLDEKTAIQTVEFISGVSGIKIANMNVMACAAFDASVIKAKKREEIYSDNAAKANAKNKKDADAYAKRESERTAKCAEYVRDINAHVAKLRANKKLAKLAKERANALIALCEETDAKRREMRQLEEAKAAA